MEAKYFSNNRKREHSSLRKYDVSASKIVSYYLYSKFYSTYTDNFKFTTDAMRDIHGIDCEFEFNGEKYLCDEKAAVQYINRPLYTFSMELSFIDIKNEEHDGWLLDKTKLTNSFLFCWIDKAKSNYITSEDDILESEIALVKKDNILNHLESIGWNIENLKKKNDRIRKNEDEELGNLRDNEIKFSKSFQLVEKPINVLIKRKNLIHISDFSYKFYKY